MFEKATAEIITNPDVLEERHVPTEALHRRQQVVKIETCLSPVLKGRRPLHCWLYGPSGSGKTFVAKLVLNRLEERHMVRSSFIDCCDLPTQYAVLNRIITDLGILGNNQERSAAFKLETIRRGLNAHSACIVLDEIGSMRQTEREKLLWAFWNMQKVGLIIISSSVQTLYGVDSRLLERLSPLTIEFPAYTPQEVRSLLHMRARLALRDSTWKPGLLQTAAGLSGGNARLAIQTLRRAAEIAEAEAKAQLQPRHIHDAFRQIRAIRSSALLQRLSKHHRVLYEILRNNPNMTSGKLRDAYLLACETSGMRPASERALQLYVETLIQRGLVGAERAQVHGNTRRLWVVE